MADDFDLLARWRLTLEASRDSSITRADLAVLMAILDRMDDSGTAWPGLNRIAADSGINRSSAVRSVKRLEERGYLERQSGTRTQSNRYRMGRFTHAPRRDAAPRRTDAPTVGAPMRLGVGAPVHPEPTQLNLPNEPTHDRPLPADRFQDFWSRYPRKEGKAKAEKAWKSGKLDAHADLIIADVTARVDDRATWTDPRFIPHPTTYLNQRRWEDEWQRARGVSTADSFHDTTYTGTALADLPESLRPRQ